MAKKAKKKARTRRRSKTSPRDLAPRKGSRAGAGSMLPPRVKWEMSELDAFKS